jgi:aspartate kinase
MAVIVQKFGGTSVANLERIREVAKRIFATKKEGKKVVAVVSAMAGETDRLLRLAKEACDNPPERECDVLASTGEQVTSALLALSLISMGCPAISLQGHQVKIITGSDFSNARIEEIDHRRLLEEIEKGNVVVVAGFQGIDREGNITTLGRGGSDLTAVALAAVLNAEICEIYTDVEGVFTTDPNICKDARKIEKISYDEMLEMASLGAKVLQTRSVELAKKYNVPVHVRSSFSDLPGTMVIKEDEEMEKVIVSGITYSSDEAKITIRRIPDRPGVASRIFTPISEANIIVDMIVQNLSEDGYADITFTVPKGHFKEAVEIVKNVARELNARDVIADSNIVKVSIVGVGMRTHAGVASKMFTALASEGINIMMISTSEIKISCVIDEKYKELAVRVLHDAFGLGQPKT